MPTLPAGSQLNIANGVREFSRALRSHVAVVDGAREITYAELGERSNRVATALLGAGLVPGDRVAVVLGNRLEYPEIAAGIAKAGMVIVPVNPRLTSDEMDFIVEHSESNAVIADVALADAIGPVIERHRPKLTLSIDGDELGVEYEKQLATARDSDPLVGVLETSPFMVAYTSGTTGRPKGVQISHRSRSLTFMSAALDWGIGPGSRTIAVAPLYHGAGFAFAYASVFCGGRLAMLRKWDPEVALAMMEKEQATTVFLVPTHAQMMRSLGEEHVASLDLSALKTLYFNAAALKMPLKEWVLDAFPGVGLHECYGSTEAGVVTNLRPEDQLARPGSVGPPWFLTEVKLLDEDRNPVAPGEVGELYSRSPYLMNGYLKDDAATEACTTPDGFITAGDLARADEDGYLSIVDRVKDMIITDGVNVYPREVEDVLLTHPAIEQVAVTGVPDDEWGEAVAAFVVLRRGAEVQAEDLSAHCRALLAGFKVPRVVRFEQSLPSSAAGKILKRELRATYLPD